MALQVPRTLASHQCVRFLDPPYVWVEFVVGFRLALGGSSPGTPVVPSSQKPTFLNSTIHDHMFVSHQV